MRVLIQNAKGYVIWHNITLLWQLPVKHLPVISISALCTLEHLIDYVSDTPQRCQQ